MKLHANIIGEGAPLLILHGFLGMGDNWKTHATNLAKQGYETHLIDQRNHGRSFHSETFNYNVLVQDLKEYMDDLNISNAILLGHSMGGKIAMQFACSYPEMVRKLIIADISPRTYPSHHNAILKGLNSVNFEIQNTRKLVDLELAKHIPEIGTRSFLCKSLYWIEKGKLGFRYNLKSLTENYKEVLKGLDQNSHFAKDTLFLKGEKSNYITESDIPQIERYFPNNKIINIANAGHWLHAENATDFFNELLNFIKN